MKRTKTKRREPAGAAPSPQQQEKYFLRCKNASNEQTARLYACGTPHEGNTMPHLRTPPTKPQNRLSTIENKTAKLFLVRVGAHF